MNWDSIWDVLWFFLVIFLWVAFFMVLFMVIGDLFRDRTMGGGGKAAWAIVLIFLPFLGTFIYLIARGSGMSDRAVAAAQHDQELAQQYRAECGGLVWRGECGRADREGQVPARLRCHHPGRVQRPEGQGAGLSRHP